jgi:TonB family protein
MSRFAILLALLAATPAFAQDGGTPPAAQTDTAHVYDAKSVDVPSQIRNRTTIKNALTRHHPGSAPDMGEGGGATFSVVIDERGVRQDIRETARVGPPEFAAAAREVVRAMRFNPAEHGGRPVRVSTEIPVVFSRP